MADKYKVLIVDDEESSRALIRLSIDWEAIGFEVIGEACNGEEALEFIEEELPDVVLTDIYMPYMNGLELSELILSQYPDLKVIVISGHDEFDYAQRGIKLGVYDFILKPIDEEEIEHTLRSVALAIKDERNIKAGYGWLKKELPYLKEKFLVDILSNDISEQDYLQRKAFTGIHTSSDDFQVTIIEIVADDHKDHVWEENNSYLCYIYLETIRDILSDLTGVIVFVDNSNNIVLLNSDQANYHVITNCLDMIMRRIIGKGGVSLAIGIGGWYHGYKNIRNSYREAIEAIGYKIVIGMNQIISYKEMVVSDGHIEGHSRDWEGQLTLYIKGGIKDEAIKIIDKIFQELTCQENIQLKNVRLKAIQLMTTMIGAVTEIGLNMDDKKNISEKSFEAIFQGHSLPEIMKVITVYVEDLCKAVGSEHLNKQQSIVNRIHSYVDENIKDQLSLKIIAEEFHLNKSYLSRIYKERTGVTLGDYILESRMEKGKMLIRTTDMKAYEVAEEVGYLDPNYFGSCFKKYTGKSISDYRKS